MSTTTLEEISQEEDTVFESEDGKGARVVIDEPSLELLSGSKIDYTMELIGSQFKVTGIPGATSSCGCGSSFDIQAWARQDKEKRKPMFQMAMDAITYKPHLLRVPCQDAGSNSALWIMSEQS
jgi:hypothetical protein